MTIRVQVDKDAVEVGCSCSPALEAILSLSVLVQPGHHPLHHAWVRETRKLLPPEMKQSLADFGFGHMDYIPADLVPEPAPEPPAFADELERIRALPLETQLRGIVCNLSGLPADEWPPRGEPAVARLSELARERGSASAALAELGLTRPRELVARFLEFLDLYWRVSFSDVWAELVPRMIEALGEARALVDAGGAPALLESLRPRIGVAADGREFWLRRAADQHIELGPGGELVFVPSAFLWPHIGLARESKRRVAVIYPASFAAFDAPAPGEDGGIVATFRALGDPTRMQILKLVAQRPRSTQELAQLVGLTAPAVSKHLRRLAEAGLVSSRRDGYYLLYGLVRERIEPLSASLLEYLEAD